MRYNDEFKTRIVNDYKKGTPAKDVIEKYSIKKSTLFDLLKVYKIMKHKDEQLGQISMELNIANVRNTCLLNDLNLYKDLLYEMELPHKQKMDYAIKLVKKGHSQKRICKILDLDHSTLSQHIKMMKPQKWWEKEEIEYTFIISKVFYDSDRRLTAGKIYPILKERGYRCSEKRIHRIMKNNNMVPRRTKSVRKKEKYINEEKTFPSFNKLQQDFHKLNPNEAWCTDVTEVRIKSVRIYICIAIECFSRMVVGWSVSPVNDSKLTINTIKKAYENRGRPKATIVHSDQGTNYCSKEFLEFLDVLELEESKSKRATPYDNAIIESFFSNLKQDDLNSRTFDKLFELEEAVKNYIDYYNNVRPHESLNMMTPSKYEEIYYKNNPSILPK